MNNGDVKGYFTDISGNDKNYWPGGLGEEFMCGCGLTGTCESDAFTCNCDIQDNATRSDFGYVLNKTDLPIGSLTFSDVGPGIFGSYLVGPLMCSQKEFGNPYFLY